MQPELATQADTGVMGALRALAQRLHLPTTLIKFLIVGGCGFLVYQAAFYLLYDSPVFWFLPGKDTRVDFGLFTHPDIRLLIGSIVAVEMAIVFQFNAHERWTFRNRQREGWIPARFVKFNVSAAVSPIIMVLTVNVVTPTFGLSPYLSSGIGVLLGFTWNWTWNTMVIWPHQKEEGAAPGSGRPLG